MGGGTVTNVHEYQEISAMHNSEEHYVQDNDGVDVVAFLTGRKTSKIIHGKDGVTTVNIPKNYYEAINGTDKEKWILAMQEEIDSHMDNGTWILLPVSQMKSNKKQVGSTWAFDVKRNEDGSIARYKARFCAQGFSQLEGVDFIITYSNTVRHNALRPTGCFRSCGRLGPSSHWGRYQNGISLRLRRRRHHHLHETATRF